MGGHRRLLRAEYGTVQCFKKRTMIGHGPIPILLRHCQEVVNRNMLSKLTTEVDILDLRLRQLTLQRTQVIYLLYEIADGI